MQPRGVSHEEGGGESIVSGWGRCLIKLPCQSKKGGTGTALPRNRKKKRRDNGERVEREKREGGLGRGPPKPVLSLGWGGGGYERKKNLVRKETGQSRKRGN